MHSQFFILAAGNMYVYTVHPAAANAFKEVGVHLDDCSE